MKIKTVDRRYRVFGEGYTTVLEFKRGDFRGPAIARWLEERYGPDNYSTAVGSNAPDFNPNWIRKPQERRIYLKNQADVSAILLTFPDNTANPWRWVTV
jgi:hypothetical protein